MTDEEVRSWQKRAEWNEYDLETPAVKDAQSVWDQTRRNYWTLAAVQPTGICFVTNEPICAAFLRCRVASAVGPEEKYLLHTCNTDVAADITEGSKNRADHLLHYTAACAELWGKKRKQHLQLKGLREPCVFYWLKKQTNKQKHTQKSWASKLKRNKQKPKLPLRFLATAAVEEAKRNVVKSNGSKLCYLSICDSWTAPR